MNMSYIGQTSADLTQRYREHICYIINNNPQSAYTQHILRNQHEYGPLQTLWLYLNQYTRPPSWYPTNNSSYTHFNIMVITTQNKAEANKILYFSWPSTPVLRHNSSITDKYLLYDTQESVPTQQERMVVALGM